VQPAFGVQAVFAYALRLRIVEKWTALSEQRGLDLALQAVEDSLAGSGV